MATFTSFASGSTGNCAFYSDGAARILIDAGCTTKYITACLAALGLGLRDLTHVLITHGHSDHISALPVLGKHTDAELVCSEDTYYSLPAPWANASVFEPGEQFDLFDCPVATFATPHDAPGSCGFVLGQGTARLGYCTDLGEMTAPVFYALSGCATLFIESNHDVDMLRAGPYPAHLKRRILSATGHLSNDRCAASVAALVKAGARRVVLGHLSRENNTPRLALEASRAALESLGARAGDVDLTVAPAAALALPLRLTC